jgi:periplasmic protein TonB
MRFIRVLSIVATLGSFAVGLAANEGNGFVKPDTAPVPVRTPPPHYPPALKKDGVAGVVTVAIVVEPTGEVSSAAIGKASHPDFEAPSLEAVKKWKFKPATKDNAPIAAKVVVPLHFNVE